MDKISSNNKAYIALIKTELRATEKGYIVARPVEGFRYDLVIDDGYKLWRAQIKYCNRSLEKNSNELRIGLGNRVSGKNFYTNNEIDCIIIWVDVINELLIFKSDLFHRKKKIYINIKNPKSKYFYKNFIW